MVVDDVSSLPRRRANGGESSGLSLWISALRWATILRSREVARSESWSMSLLASFLSCWRALLSIFGSLSPSCTLVGGGALASVGAGAGEGLGEVVDRVVEEGTCVADRDADQFHPAPALLLESC